MQYHFFKKLFYALSILAIVFSATSPVVFAAPGVPNIVNYQGRLTDNAGRLLGGSGTNYYFRFSLWTTPTVGGGSKLWPAGQPGTVTTNVVDGVFNVNIGDTVNGYPDALDYNFNDSDAVYLQIEVSSNGSSFETLGPRQRIVSSGYAINAQTVAGLAPGTSANNILTLGADGEIVLSSTGVSTLGDIAAGVISAGTWNGSAIEDTYFVKTGDWTGLFDGNEGSYYLDANNLTNFDTRIATAVASLTTDDIAEGDNNFYFSNTLARGALSAGSGITYDNTSGVISNSGALSFNTRTGDITLVSGDVTDALGFAPMNPSGTTAQYFRGNGTLATFPTTVSSFTNDSGFITGNQTITLSGDISGSGTTAITTAIGAGKVTNTMLAGSIAASKLVGTDIVTVGTIGAGTWNGTVITPAYGGTGVSTITGIVKGNGTSAFTAAVAGTDYEVPLTFSTGLTRSTNTITIDNTVVTLTGSQALSNKTGNISQWTNDVGYATGGGTASGTNTGDITLGTIGSSPNTSGASLVGQVLTLQPADATRGGVLTATAQEILGEKKFLNRIVIEKSVDSSFIANSTTGRSVAVVSGALKSSFLFDNGGPFSIQTNTKANVNNGTPSGVSLLELSATGDMSIGTTTAADQPRLDVLVATASITTASRTVIRGRNAGSSFVTSGQAKTNYIAEFINTATRSTGANNLTNVALYASASGAQVNYAGIFAAGNVGIGDVTPDYTLDVKGTICQDTDSDETCDGSVTSDARLKTNIETIPSALEKIRQLRGVYFDWDETNSHTAFLGRGTRQVGVIAQEIEAVFPSLIYRDSSGYRMVDYQKLTGPLIEAVKELDIQVQAIPVYEDETFTEKIADFLRGIAERGEAIIDTVRAKKLCAEDVCINRDQLQEMIEYINNQQEQSSGGSSSNPPVDEEIPPGDAEPEGDTVPEGGEDTPPAEEELVLEETPEPEPVPEESPEPEPESPPVE
ncbi:MAG TPA: tail fiber domain-containing protein [Candidatus Paceibacterota bacterium]